MKIIKSISIDTCFKCKNPGSRKIDRKRFIMLRAGLRRLELLFYHQVK
jgi:hypothetical protein